MGLPIAYSHRFRTIHEAGLGGWETSGLVSLQSGPRYSIANGTSSSLNGIGLDRADIVGSPYLPSRSRQAEIKEWFNTQAFVPAVIGTAGDSGRNFLAGPAFLDADVAIVKNFPIGDRFAAYNSVRNSLTRSTG